MSTDESALLAAVAADPANDLPRLVYADWLDDHDQPVRAEFIRLQCEIARLEVGPRAVVDANWRLWKRQQDLLDGHLSELLGPAAGFAVAQPRFRRGFVDDIGFKASRFEMVQPALLSAAPPPGRVAVHEVARSTPAIQESDPAALNLVTELHAIDPPTHELTFTDILDGEFLLRTSRWPRLAVLDLAGAEYGAGTLGWFAADAYPALRAVDLAGNGLTDGDIIELLNIGIPQRLTRLVLDGNPVGDQAAFELADRLGKVPTFRTLDFRHTRVTSAGQAALTSAFGSRCNLF